MLLDTKPGVDRITGCTVADRDHKTRPEKDVELAELDLPGADGGDRRLVHDQMEAVVALYLRALVGLPCVFHRALVQVELFAPNAHPLRARLFQLDPDVVATTERKRRRLLERHPLLRLPHA